MQESFGAYIPFVDHLGFELVCELPLVGSGLRYAKTAYIAARRMVPPWHTATPCHVWEIAYHKLGPVS